MARFTDEELNEFRNSIDLVALIESYGTKLRARQTANEYVGCCPLHDDQTPSLFVNRAKGLWQCKGACGVGGDAFAWIMKAEKCTFLDAIDSHLAGKIATHGPKTPIVVEKPIELTNEDYQRLTEVANYYHNQLKLNESANGYLQSRGLYDLEAIEQFKIGVCDRTLGLNIPNSQYKAGKNQRTQLERLGVIKQTGHEALRGCVTFPIVNAAGEACGMYGRRTLRGTPKNERHWYLSGKHVGVWNAAAFEHASKEIILCESIIDALTFWIAGFRNATCSYGNQGFTEELLTAFLKANTKLCWIAWDNDEKSNPLADALADKLLSHGIQCKRVVFPKSTPDANDYAMKIKDGNGSAHGSLSLLMRNAETYTSKDIDVMKRFVPNQASVVSLQSSANPSQPEALARDTQQPAPYEPQSASSHEPVENLSSLAADGQATGERPEAGANVEQLPSTVSAVPDQPQCASTGLALPQPSTLNAQISGNEVLIEIGNRSYRIRGLSKTSTYDTMKINLLVRKGEQFFVDTLDMYQARQRAHFIREAAREIEIDDEAIKRDLGRILQKLEQIQHEQSLVVESKEKAIEISEDDRAKALELLRSPDLIARVVADFDACGVVGEETNKLIGYLAATSRKLSQPLAVLIQSSSAAGKSSLMEAVLSFMPPEEQIKYSAMTGQSLFYMGATNLKHRILAIAEEEGVEQAAYALKLLQSEGKLNIASTGKDPGTGRMETQEYHVEGPVMIFLTTTSDETDPELKNRCVVLGVCEHACHTEAIHQQQRNRRTMEGQQLQFERRAIKNLHQNAQRLLRPLCVVNNYANQLTFRTDKTKSRRAHEHYLTLIESITLLHQYQRSMKSMTIAGEQIEYIETTLEDIELANKLADRFLERSFAELPERTNVLLEQILGGVRNLAEFQVIELSEVHFTRKDVRRWSTFGDTQLKQHLARLVDYEYLKVEPSKDRGRTIIYSMAYDPVNNPTMGSESGLVDVNRLRVTSEPDKVGLSAGQESSKVGGSSDKVGPVKSESINENIDPTQIDASKQENDQKGAA